MTKFYKFILTAIVAASPLLASANALAKWTADPADGSEVDEIHYVYLNFPDAPEGTDENVMNSATKITLKDAEGNLVQNAYKVFWAESATQTTKILFEPTVSEPGEYTVTIPAETFKAYEGFEDDVNEEIVLHYTILDPTQKPSVMDEWTVDPEDGSTVDEIHYVKIKFPNAAQGTEVRGGATGNVKVFNAAGEDVGTCSKINIAWSSKDATTFIFEPQVTAAGEYTVVIPAATVYDYKTGDDNKEIVLHYTIEGDEPAPVESVLNEYTVKSPEDGAEVESISKILIQFSKSSLGVSLVGQAADVVITNAAGEQVSKCSAIKCAMSGGYDTEFTFSPAVTEPGEYTVTFPAGLLKAFNITPDNLSPEIVLHYTIPTPQEKPNVMDQWTVDPADGSTVKSIGYVRVYFSNAPQGTDVRFEAEKNVKAYNSNGAEPIVCSKIMYATSKSGATAFIFEPAITTPGEYTVKIPAGSVFAYGVGDDNKEIELHYTIEGDEPTPNPDPDHKPSILDEYIVKSPADGSEVEELSLIKIQFNKTSLGVSQVGKAADVVITNAAGEEVSECSEIKCAWSGGYDTEFTFSPKVTAPGEYTVTIPAGTLKAYNVTPDNLNPEIVLHYTIAAKPGALEAFTLTPNPATKQRGLSFFKFEFTAVNNIEAEGAADEVTVTDEEGNEVAWGASTFVCYDNQLQVVLDRTITTPGKYTVTFPEGLAKDAESGDLSPEYIAEYEVVNAGEYSNTMTTYTLSPEDGAVVAELQKIEVAFPLPADGIEFGVSKDNISYYATLVGNGQVYRAVSYAFNDDFTGGYIIFDPITEPGIYEFWLAPDVFYDFDLAESSETGDGFVGNPEIRATFEVSDEVTPPAPLDTMNEYTLTPADGEEVDELEEIAIAFDLPADGIDQNYNISAVDAATLTDEDGTVYYPVLVALSSDCTRGIIRFERITTPGTYVLNVVEGLFSDYQDERATSPAITATYTIVDPGHQGVSAIELDAEGTEVYDLQGRKPVKGNLAPGFYIVNGKKVYVK